MKLIINTNRMIMKRPLNKKYPKYLIPFGNLLMSKLFLLNTPPPSIFCKLSTGEYKSTSFQPCQLIVFREYS